MSPAAIPPPTVTRLDKTMTVKEIFDTMDYGPAPESASEALAWLVDRGDAFGHFINGSFTKPSDGFPSKNPATGETLAMISQGTQSDDQGSGEATIRGGAQADGEISTPGNQVG